MSTPSYTVTNDSITVILGGRAYSIRRGSRNFEAAKRAIMEERWDDVPSLVSSGLAIERWLSGQFQVVEGFVTYQGERVDPALNDRMLRMAEKGADPSGWMKFWERLQANPSYRSVTQLYSFLTHEDIPIDEADGHILAYKSVTRDYKDHHTRQYDNRPGVTNWMPRNKISDDPNVACHEGFHVGAIGYARGFGGDGKRIVVCKVDPADVVCVPYDSSAMKVRVCKYTVVGNYGGVPLESPSFRDDEDAPELTPPPPRADAISGGETPPPPGARPIREDADVRFTGTSIEEAVADLDSPWAKYDAMGEAELDKVLFPDLRKYARHGLQIIGASKMHGSKHDLVLRILEVRTKKGEA